MHVFTATNSAVQTQADKSVTGASAVQLVTATPSVVAKQKIIVQSKAANTDKIRVGDSNVTTTRGIELAPGDSVTFDGLQDPSLLYAIVLSGTQTVIVAWW